MKVVPPLDITTSNGRLTSTTIPDVPTASGAWSSGSTYTAGVIVSRATTNSMYRALVDINPASSITPEDSIISQSPVWTEIGPAAWVSGTTYSPGQKVFRATTQRVYLCLVSTAPVNTMTPETLSSVGVNYWADTGPSNKMAMFDYLRNSASKAETTINVRLTPGQRISTVVLVGLKNISTVRVKADTSTTDLNTDTNLDYDQTLTLTERESLTWSDYFFDPITFSPSAIFENIPLSTSIIVDITLTGSNIECGGVIIGYAENIGTVQRGATNDVINFSSVTRDAFGNATMVQRRNVPRTNQTLFADASQVNNIRRIRDQLNAVPAAWIGLDNSVANQYYFESLLIIGFYKTFSITIDNPIGVMINLELEEI